MRPFSCSVPLMLIFFLAALSCEVVVGLAAPLKTRHRPPPSFIVCPRREALLVGICSAAVAVAAPLPFQTQTAWARAPGSKDVSEAITQIQDASYALRKLENDWSLYSVIDDEGRAGSTDGARRILGGIAPQAGTAAIEAAQKTPLYRIDVAFVTVRKAALEGDEEWAANLDLDRFEELAEKILYEVQKADGNFYGVLFAAKGTKMIQDILNETKYLVQQGISDLDQMIGLLKDAGAPGLVS